MKSFLLRFTPWIIVCILGVFAFCTVSGFILPTSLGMLLRWLGVVILLFYGYSKRSLTAWIIVAMYVGGVIGFDFPLIGKELNILGKIFIKLIKTVIAPLLFGTLIVGIAGHSDLKQVGRLGWKSLLYFEVVTTIALFLGLFAINISGAGFGISQSLATEEVPPVIKQQGWQELILHIFPENLFKSVADGQVLQIVVFTIIFAIAMLMCSKERRAPMVRFAELLSEIMFKFTDIIMYFAPFAVGGAIAYTIAKMGIDVLKPLFMLLCTLYVALIVFVLGVLLPIALWARIPIRRFIQYASQPVSIAFGTASSEAALPSAMENMEKFGVTREVVSFVLPTGLSFNLDGTTLYLALASVFVAQAAGIEMTLGQQLVMMLTLMLTSKGVAGVARASLVILAGTAASFGLPEWPIAVILGIDALMDMGRTAVNTLGNCLATAIIGRWENELNIPEAGFVEGKPLSD